MANISRIKLDETTYEIKDAQAARASDLATKQDALTAGDGIAIDSNDIIRTTGIPFGVVDSTSTSTAYTVTVPGIYKLEEGVCCLVRNGKVTSESGFTLNVNGLGAKPSYSNMATGNTHTPTAPTRDTTIFNINYTMLFIYTTSLPDVPNGAWICYRGYDANTNTIGYQVRSNSHSLPASQKFYRYRLLFTSADGTHYVPANTSSSTNATASRTVNQTPIDPFGHIVYYGTTAAVDANARPSVSALWVIYTLNLGYSFNKTGAALTLDDWAPVYLKCAPQANGSAIIDADTPYVQALPTTADGKIYIFLGVAYNATSIELLNSHPVYYHDGTGIRIWTGINIASSLAEKQDKPIELYEWLEDNLGDGSNFPMSEDTARELTAQEFAAIQDIPNHTWVAAGYPAILESSALSRGHYIWNFTVFSGNLRELVARTMGFRKTSDNKYWFSSSEYQIINPTLATVATSGSYNDLSDKPNIPSVAGLATETYVNTAVSNLVDSAPQTLDTLNELAAALGNDANFSTTVTNAIASKRDKPIGFLGWGETYFNDWQDFPRDEANARELTSSEAAAIQDIHQNAWNREWCFEVGSYPMTYSWNGEDANIWTVLLASGDTVAVMSWVLHYNSNNEYWFTQHQSTIATTDIFATVATSGSYNDLTNKPTIPAAVTVDSSLTGSSQTNPVQGGAIYSALQGKEDRQRVIVDIQCDVNQPIGYSVGGNTITGAELYALCADPKKDVVLRIIGYDNNEDDDPDYSDDILYYRIQDSLSEYEEQFYASWWSGMFLLVGLCIESEGANIYFEAGIEEFGYVPTTRKINNKPLWADVTLTASDVGAMSTSHPANAITSAKITEWNGKQDALVSGTNIKTINNQSLLGSGNITPAQLGVPSIANNLTTTTVGSALDATQGKALKDTVDTKADKVTIVTVSTTGAVTQALDPNKFYKFTGSPTSLTVTLNSGLGLCVYAGKFTAGTGFSGFTLPSGVAVADGAPTIEAGETYEFNIADNLIVIVKQSS